MRLWLLAPSVSDGADDPWDPWYDKTHGGVVRAETEGEARAIMASHARDEGAAAWLDPALSSCVELITDGDPGPVLIDFRGA